MILPWAHYTKTIYLDGHELTEHVVCFKLLRRYFIFTWVVAP